MKYMIKVDGLDRWYIHLASVGYVFGWDKSKAVVFRTLAAANRVLKSDRFPRGCTAVAVPEDGLK